MSRLSWAPVSRPSQTWLVEGSPVEALGEVQALGDALHQHSFTGVIVGDWAPFGPQEMQIAVFS